MYEKVCPTYVNNIGRARSICAEITRSLEYCFHYIRNVIAIFKSEKILFQVECLTFGVFDYIRTSSVYSVLQCYKAHDIGTFYDSIYMLYWNIHWWIKILVVSDEMRLSRLSAGCYGNGCFRFMTNWNLMKLMNGLDVTVNMINTVNYYIAIYT